MSHKKLDKEDFIHMPEYPGGNKALRIFIANNLRYPEQALENKAEGTVLISYRIGFDGSVSEAKVLKGVGHGCDEEALRLVKMLRFSPQNNHGVKVTTTKKIKIHFRLPVSPPKGMTVQYEVKQKVKVEDSTKKENTYTYTITI